MPTYNNIVGIIQARMGSTRLPGKVMMDVMGEPILWHVVERLRYCKLIDKIVIATTVDKRDDVIEEFCNSHQLDFYRGCENDVLDRCYQAAKRYKADCIVRITADCPLIDPKIVDLVIDTHLENNSDYTSNTLKRTFPRGLDTEIFTFSALERAFKEAGKSYQREHVSVYFYENPQLFKLHNLEDKQNLSYLRWTVDEERDLEFIRGLYKRLYKGKNIFLMNDILDILRKEPHLLEINKEVKQKKMK